MPNTVGHLDSFCTYYRWSGLGQDLQRPPPHPEPIAVRPRYGPEHSLRSRLIMNPHRNLLCAAPLLVTRTEIPIAVPFGTRLNPVKPDPLQGHALARQLLMDLVPVRLGTARDGSRVRVYRQLEFKSAITVGIRVSPGPYRDR